MRRSRSARLNIGTRRSGSRSEAIEFLSVPPQFACAARAPDGAPNWTRVATAAGVDRLMAARSRFTAIILIAKADIGGRLCLQSIHLM
jgi:hypothetical protein